MPTLRNPAVYFAHPSYGRPIGLGKVFIITSGLSVPSDASAVDAGDLQDVFYNDSEGNQIQVSQPLNTTKGGLLYSDDPVIIRQYYTDASTYIVAVYDSSGTLVYADTMAGTFGNGGGSAGAAAIVNDWDDAITAGFYQDSGAGSANQPVSGRRYVGWVSNVNEAGDSLVQFVMDVSVSNGAAYQRSFSLGIPGSWRNIWDSSSFTKQSSAIDSTAGAAMLVGAAGWLSTAIEWTNSLNDLDVSASYKLSSSATDAPLGATVLDSTVLHIKVDSVTAHQLFIEAGTGAIWSRTRIAGAGIWSTAGRTGIENKTANYEFVTTDFGSTVRFSGGTTMTATLVSGLAYDGALLQIINRNSGNLSITPTGVTLTWLAGGAALTGARTLLAHSACTVLRVNASNYEIYGFGLA